MKTLVSVRRFRKKKIIKNVTDISLTTNDKFIRFFVNDELNLILLKNVKRIYVTYQ